MDRTTESTRIRRLLACAHSAEGLGDPGVRRALAARGVWEGLLGASRRSLVAGRIPAFLPRGESQRSRAGETRCAPACCT